MFPPGATSSPAPSSRSSRQDQLQVNRVILTRIMIELVVGLVNVGSLHPADRNEDDSKDENDQNVSVGSGDKYES